MGAVVALGLSACGSSGSANGGHQAPAGSALRTADVSGAGTLVVDGRGYTVYVLLDAQDHDVPCTQASGCLAVWPAVNVVAGSQHPRAGAGVEANLVGASSGQATYHGWLLYEYTGDPGRAQANGVGLQSFGGTWYALHADGTLVSTVSAPTTSSTYGAY